MLLTIIINYKIIIENLDAHVFVMDSQDTIWEFFKIL